MAVLVLSVPSQGTQTTLPQTRFRLDSHCPVTHQGYRVAEGSLRSRVPRNDVERLTGRQSALSFSRLCLSSHFGNDEPTEADATLQTYLAARLSELGAQRSHWWTAEFASSHPGLPSAFSVSKEIG